MKLKTLIVTVSVLAVLAVIAFIARRPTPPPSADPRIGQRLVDPELVPKAAKVRITDAGKSVVLHRGSDGTWRVASYHDFPADFQKLSGFIGNLTDAKLQRLVTSNPDRIARLEFKDTKIELLDGSDKTLWSATLGKTPETGGGRFVKFGDENKAFLASLSAWLDTESKNWAQSELINLKSEDVAKIELPFPEGTVVVSRAKKEDPWTSENAPAGQRVKADKISSVLSSLGSVRFSDTAEPSDPNVAAAKADLRTFKLTTFDGKTHTIAMGRKPEEKKLKPPGAGTDGKSGPASLGSLTDLAKKDEAKAGEEKKDDKPLAPEFETIPAGPVYVFVTHADASAPVNSMMEKRAFQISEYTFTGLPQKQEEIFEPAPPATPAPPSGTEAPKEAPKP